MIIGVKDLTWAKVSGGGAGAAMSYTGGAQETDLMVRADQSEDRADAAFYADDHAIDRDNSVTAAHVALEVAKLTTNMLTDLVGYVAGTGANPDVSMTDAAAPYVGIGFVYVEQYKGTKTYLPYWYYKVQFSYGSRSFNTKGESVEFQTESLEGEAMAVQLTEGGSNSFYVRPQTALTTEAAAIAWLKTKAGIS